MDRRPALSTTFATALAERPLVLDGGLSTELERRGHDLSGDLWSARVLHDDPAAVVAVHQAFVRAGADVITTASYQATTAGFARAGFDPAQARNLLIRSVSLAHQARDEAGAAPGHPGQAVRPVWVAGSVGPYGVLLADGSEYTGDYGDVGAARLRAFHAPKLEVLASAGVDVIAAETVPSLAEAEALLVELAALGHPAWLSMTTVTGADGVVRTRRGEPAAEAFEAAAGVDAVVAVGVNCTDAGGVTAAVEVAAQASGKPVIAYPNSGEGWDPIGRRWTPSPDPEDAGDPGRWLAAGARVVGGCCRVGPDRIAAIARSVQ